MTCSSCGTENEAGRKFCKECGAPLASRARAAAPRTPPTPSSAASAPRVSSRRARSDPGQAAAPSPVAERRVVSVLFADLVGFTTFAEGRDAEEVRETLTRYFDLAHGRRRPLRRHGREVHRRRRDGRLGRARPPTRTTPSAPSGPASSWSTRSAPSGRASRRGPAC